jgi:hypothetical protein
VSTSASSKDLTTGRRHIRTGSVHVTELIGRQSRPFDLASELGLDADEPIDTGALDSLLEAEYQPSSHRRPPSKGAQVAKIAGLGVASIVLCASIAVGSMITHHRRDGSADTARPAMDISGEQALLPDLLNEAVPSAGLTGTPALAGAPSVATGMIDNPGPPRPHSTLAGPPDPSAAPPGAEAAVSKTQLVERFYPLASTAPDRAFGLLDSRLLGTDLNRFVQSWSSVRDVQVLDVHEEGDDVLAVVRLRLLDGSYLSLHQLLGVADTLPRRITGAQILSAQRN